MYSDHIAINKNYQSSINLELDLDNEAKINEYIPTHDICDVIKRYANAVLGITKEKSTVMVGPYGKGKSFILLVISFLFSKNKETKGWNNLVNKIKKIDIDLYKLLVEIKSKNINLVPVIINSNYSNINQSFQLALYESLKRCSLENILPTSAFDIALQLFEKWNSDESLRNSILKKCLENNHINESQLIAGLKGYSYESFQDFNKIYYCVNGLEFNPLVSGDIVKIYSDVSEKLINHGYSGLFIIFDEFSKFIESTSENLMKDLKIVQDMAESSVRSKNSSQIHLCCVTHKPISLYGFKSKNENYNDSFKTVEGRFVEIRFNRSLEENYSIISGAIEKDKEAKRIADNYISSNADLYNGIRSLNIFDNSIINELFNGCFPLNPITSYLLIQLSELVAQNERTLFTFLSDTDENSFNSFIHRNDGGLFNTDKIYDYFNGLLQKEEQNQIRNIWYRSETLLSKTTDTDTRRIIKTLAIILMVGDFDKIPPTEENLSLGANIEIGATKGIVNELMQKHYLRRNLLNNTISFALSSSKRIDETIEYLRKTKFKNLDYASALNRINEKRFVLPRRYNEQNKITRFFSVFFMSEEEFINLSNFDLYRDSFYCDGIVFNLLRTSIDEPTIKDKINRIGAKNVIIKYPNEPIGNLLFETVMRHECLNDIRKQKDIDEIMEQELDLMINEAKADITSLIELSFSANTNIVNSLISDVTFPNMLSLIMEKIFTEKLIFNNELVNKRHVSSQYQKAVNHVIDYLLFDEEWKYSETSPENSIRMSIIDLNESSIALRNIINQIKTKIIESNGIKITIDSIIKVYKKEPYGIRDGILPVILAKAISELSESIVMYFQNKEIELNSINIVKSITNNKYLLSASCKTKEKMSYLSKMMELYKVQTTNNFNKDVILLSERIKRYFVGMPQALRTVGKTDNYLGVSNSFIDYRNVFLGFNLNPTEAIFDIPKKCFGTNDYLVLLSENRLIVNDAHKLLNPIKAKLIAITKELFGFGETTSLKMGLTGWISKYCEEGETPLLSGIGKTIFAYASKQNTYDDYEFVNGLAESTVGSYVEDWDKDNTSKFIDGINNFKEGIGNAKVVNVDDIASQLLGSEVSIELSPIAELMKNNIESILDEFSNSISEEEIISILSEIIKKIIR